MSLLGLSENQCRHRQRVLIREEIKTVKEFHSYFFLSTILILASSWARRLSYTPPHREFPAFVSPRANQSILFQLNSLHVRCLRTRFLCETGGICRFVKGECSLNMPVSRRDIESFFSYQFPVSKRTTNGVAIEHRNYSGKRLEPTDSPRTLAASACAGDFAYSLSASLTAKDCQSI